MELTTTNNDNQPTMTSLQLVDFINEDRKLVAEETGGRYVELLHKNFMAKVPEVLGENHAAKFLASQKYGNNNERNIYIFPEREATLMAMSYSYSLQAKVYDEFVRMKKVGQSAKEIENKYFHLMDQRLSTMEGLLSNITALVNNLAIQQTPNQTPTDDPSNYFRVVEYGQLFYSHIPDHTLRENAKTMGGLVSSISKKLGLKIIPIKNEKYGNSTNTYHKSALKEAYAKFYN